MVAAVDHFAPDMLVHLDRSAGKGIRAQIEQQLRAGVREGRLHPGTRLPSSRELARRPGAARGVVVEALGAARGVVVKASERLAAEGWIVSRQVPGRRAAPGAAPPAEPEPSSWTFEE